MNKSPAVITETASVAIRHIKYALNNANLDIIARILSIVCKEDNWAIEVTRSGETSKRFFDGAEIKP